MRPYPISNPFIMVDPEEDGSTKLILILVEYKIRGEKNAARYVRQINFNGLRILLIFDVSIPKLTT